MSNAVISLTQATTGITVNFSDELLIVDNEPCIYIWEEGNYSCDCNRSLFWHREQGLIINDEYVPCSEGEYKVSIYRADNGALIYGERTNEN